MYARTFTTRFFLIISVVPEYMVHREGGILKTYRVRGEKERERQRERAKELNQLIQEKKGKKERRKERRKERNVFTEH